MSTSNDDFVLIVGGLFVVALLSAILTRRVGLPVPTDLHIAETATERVTSGLGSLNSERAARNLPPLRLSI